MKGDEIRAIIDSLVSKELPLAARVAQPWTRGGVQQDERMLAVMRWAAERHGGDLVEIGCSCGATTSMMGKVAREFRRRVIGVDPWEPNRPNYDPVNYGKFLDNTYPWADLVDVIKLPSEDERAILAVKAHPLCFAYVDGAHDYEHCLRDLHTTAHAYVIAADDMWEEGVQRAVAEFGREMVYNELCKEAYLI